MYSRNLTASLCAALMLAVPPLAQAERVRPLPHPIGQPRQPAASPVGSASDPANPWTPLTNQPTFLVNGAANPILLTDGSVLVQDTGFPDWWKLTPDQNGSYING